ncbi:tripartite tricarboxylate transporter substrate binding protein [Caldovatus aquaticus]|uniref:Tripartite tricarboxylate transporter substrate binding protein n=1 Tax=Caldovatus aquaticus TaxID=2865671 RepID=A0ABS7F4S5_9PROT|nr:tripartite tricarboxylate transporter substrate binding protein [Caldovatus aquaticus]
MVPYPPGGGTDVVARWVARELTPRIGQPVVVENRPGANGIVAMQHVQGAPADGHTLVMTTADTVSVNPYVYRRLPYRPEAFVPVAAVTRLIFALVVRPGFGAGDARAFVARAKAAGTPVTFASWGVASTSQVMMESLRAEAGFDAQHVPFQGAAPAVQAMLAEQVDAMMMPVGLALAQGGRLRILGVASHARFPGAAEVPTLIEQGFRLAADLWMGVLGPPGLPAAAADRISAAVQEFVRAPEAAAFFTPNGMVAHVADRAAFAATIRADDALWRERAERLGVKLDE